MRKYNRSLFALFAAVATLGMAAFPLTKSFGYSSDAHTISKSQKSPKTTLPQIEDRSPNTLSDSLRSSLEELGFTAVSVVRGPGHHLEVIAEVNGEKGLFLIDTGSQITIIDRASAKRFHLEKMHTGLRIYGAVGGPGENIDASVIKSLKLGSAVAAPFLVGIADIRTLRAGHHPLKFWKTRTNHFDGIIGADFLENFPTVIDYAGPQLLVCQDDSNLMLSGQSDYLGRLLRQLAYIQLDMTRHTVSEFEVTVKLNDKPAVMLVDTGAAMTLFDKKFALQAGIVSKPSEYAIDGAGGGKQMLNIGVIDNLQIDALQLHAIPVAVTDISSVSSQFEKEGRPALDGYLGSDFLDARNAVIDCQHMRLYIKP